MTPIPSDSQRSSVSLLVSPSSRASSYTRMFPAKSGSQFLLATGRRHRGRPAGVDVWDGCRPGPAAPNPGLSILARRSRRDEVRWSVTSRQARSQVAPSSPATPTVAGAGSDPAARPSAAPDALGGEPGRLSAPRPRSRHHRRLVRGLGHGRLVPLLGRHGLAALGRLPHLLAGGRVDHPFAFGPVLVEVGLLLGQLGLALDVDAPTGQPGGQTGVLPFLADGQRQLVVGHDHLGHAGVLVDAHLLDLGRRQRLHHEVGRVVAEGDDVDLLAPQLVDHHAHARRPGRRRRRPRDRRCCRWTRPRSWCGRRARGRRP